MPTTDEIKAAAQDFRILLGTFDPADMDSWYGLTSPVYCYHDLKRVPHLLVAGHDGAGKTALMHYNYLATAALAPESYTVVHITPEYHGGDGFSVWEAPSALDQVGRSMDEREKKLAESGHSDWDELRRSDKGTENKILLVIVDGLEDVIGDSTRYITRNERVSATAGLTDIMRRGRGLGVHLIATTHSDTLRDWVDWERKLPPFSTTLAFSRYSCMPRAVWYEGQEVASPEFSVYSREYTEW